MDQNASPPTIYTVYPLDPAHAEIRLLKVELAHSSDGALRCAFYTVSLDQHAPPFTAVSYCWGRAEHDHVIYMGLSAIKVTKTVEEVLRGVVAHGARFVWIDQVCIDQSNTQERNNQLALMSFIYSRADHVLVYLGQAGQHTSLAVDFAEHYRGRLRGQNVPETDIAQVSTAESVAFVASKKPLSLPNAEVLRHVALGLVDLLSRPFFTRLWIVQEVVLANNVETVCGSRHFRWDIIRLACLLFTRRPELASLLKSFVHIDCDFSTMHKASRLVKEHGNHIDRDLWSLLEKCSGLATSEPKDKIYAVLGLAKRTPDMPKPDYARSVGEVYLDFARYFVRIGLGIKVIDAAIANDRQEEPGYPSWAPWFDKMDANEHKRAVARMNAAANTAPVVQLGRQMSDIIVQGALIDSIIDIGPPGPTQGAKPASPSLEHETFLTWIERSFALLEAHDIPFAAATLTSVLLQESPKIIQVVGGSAELRLVDASNEVLSNALSDFMDSLRTLSGRSGLRTRLMTFRFKQVTSTGGHITLLNDFAFEAISNLRGRRVFVTKQNRVGIASNTVGLGDNIAIISGGRTPYVLREKRNLRQIYTLITWAYVQGVMHGEALDERGCHIEDLTLE